MCSLQYGHLYQVSSFLKEHWPLVQWTKMIEWWPTEIVVVFSSWYGNHNYKYRSEDCSQQCLSFWIPIVTLSQSFGWFIFVWLPRSFCSFTCRAISTTWNAAEINIPCYKASSKNQARRHSSCLHLWCSLFCRGLLIKHYLLFLLGNFLINSWKHYNSSEHAQALCLFGTTRDLEFSRITNGILNSWVTEITALRSGDELSCTRARTHTKRGWVDAHTITMDK